MFFQFGHFDAVGSVKEHPLLLAWPLAGGGAHFIPPGCAPEGLSAAKLHTWRNAQLATKCKYRDPVNAVSLLGLAIGGIRHGSQVSCFGLRIISQALGSTCKRKRDTMKHKTICRGAQGLIFALSFAASAAFAQGNSAQHANWRAIDNRTAHAQAQAAQFQRAAGPGDPISIAVVLKLNNPDALQSLITAQHTPGNASYHKWLNSAQSAQQFGPTQA
jgi:hypothetical protein